MAESQTENVEAVALIAPEDQEPALTTGRLILTRSQIRVAPLGLMAIGKDPSALLAGDGILARADRVRLAAGRRWWLETAIDTTVAVEAIATRCRRKEQPRRSDGKQRGESRNDAHDASRLTRLGIVLQGLFLASGPCGSDRCAGGESRLALWAKHFSGTDSAQFRRRNLVSALRAERRQ